MVVVAGADYFIHFIRWCAHCGRYKRVGMLCVVLADLVRCLVRCFRRAWLEKGERRARAREHADATHTPNKSLSIIRRRAMAPTTTTTTTSRSSPEERSTLLLPFRPRVLTVGQKAPTSTTGRSRQKAAAPAPLLAPAPGPAVKSSSSSSSSLWRRHETGSYRHYYYRRKPAGGSSSSGVDARLALLQVRGACGRCVSDHSMRLD